MTQALPESDRLRLREELGLQRFEAIGHFLTDGDYLGFNCSDFRGAIAEYEKAWQLLSTPWQRETGGADILEGIADFALRSEDPGLAQETLTSLAPRAAESGHTSVDLALANLASLANKR
jgi:hypothetical protein